MKNPLPPPPLLYTWTVEGAADPKDRDADPEPDPYDGRTIGAPEVAREPPKLERLEENEDDERPPPE